MPVRIRTFIAYLGFAGCLAGPAYAGQPSFIENKGQWDSQAKFLAQTEHMNFWVTSGGPVFDFLKSGKSLEDHQVVRMDIVDTKGSKVLGFDQRAGVYNYLIGQKSHWVTGVHSYAQTTALDPLSGVSVRYTIDQGAPRYDLIVKPGVDPSKVALKIRGADEVKVLDNGDLLLKTKLGDVEERGLVAYQGEGAYRTQVACRMALDGDALSFDVGAYDAEKPLVIDPMTVTYIGGTEDTVNGVAIDIWGNVYVTGHAGADQYPTTTGAYQRTRTGTPAFVTKLTADLSGLVYSTYIGGNGLDTGLAIGVDGSGNAYIGGSTTSTNFPTTANAMATSGNYVVTKLNAKGNGLGYSTYYFGSLSTVGVDSMGEAVIGGNAGNVPVTAGSYQMSPGGSSCAYLAKFSASGSSFVYATYIGGPGAYLQSNVVNAPGDSRALVTVNGFFDAPDLDSTGAVLLSDSYDPTSNYVAAVNGAGNFVGADGKGDTPTEDVWNGQYEYGPPPQTWISSTPPYVTEVNGVPLGGSGGFEGSTEIFEDAAGNAYDCGQTQSSDFPVTSDAALSSAPGTTTFTDWYNATFEAWYAIFGNYPVELQSPPQTLQNPDENGASTSGFFTEISPSGHVLYSTFVPNQISGFAANGTGEVAVIGSGWPASENAYKSSGQAAIGLITNGAVSPTLSLASSSVTGGVSTSGSINFSNPLYADTSIGLSASNGYAQVPSYVVAMHGSASQSFTITTSGVTATTQVVISAGPLSRTLTINPASLYSLTLSPSSVVGGGNTQGIVEFSGKVGASRIVTVSSANPALVQVPSEMAVDSQTSHASFNITTKPVSATTPVQISISQNGVTQMATLTLKLPAISSLTAVPSSVKGGGKVDGIIYIASAAGPQGDNVTITASSGSVSVPLTVPIPAGKNYAVFTITTKPVTAQVQVTITATMGASVQRGTLTLTP
jgi:hypothetical protein